MKVITVIIGMLLCTMVTPVFAQKATSQEVSDFQKFVKEKNLKSIDVPFAFVSGGVNFAGIVSVRDPFDSSSLKALALGAIIGECNLDKNRTECTLKDPTNNILRVVLKFDFAKREISGRIDNRKWDTSWNEGTWVVAWRG